MKKNLFTIMLAFLVVFGVNAQKSDFSLTSVKNGVKEKAIGQKNNHRIFTVNSKAAILSEDFEGGVMPTGWSQQGGAVDWVISSDNSSTYWTIPAHTVYASINDDAPGSGADNSDTYIQTASFDLSSATAPKLNFEGLSYGSSTTFTLKSSIDGGTTWVDITTYLSVNSWVAQETSLSSLAGQSDVKLRFHYNDGGSWGYGWAIDDVVVSEPEPDDLAAVSVTPSGINGLLEVTPSAIVQNVGGNNASNFNVAITINDGTSDVYSQNKDFADVVTAGSTFNAAMDLAWTPTAAGTYTVTATITYAADANAGNDVATATYTVVDGLLWGANIDITSSTNGIVSTDLGGLGASPAGLIETADDFTLPAGNWDIDSISSNGFQSAGALDGFRVIIYADNGGAPGNIVFEELVPVTNPDHQQLVFANTLALTGGTYWLTIAGNYASASAVADGRWNWFTWDNLTLNETVLRDHPDAFGTGNTNWQTLSSLGVTGAQSTNFAVYGKTHVISTENNILTYGFTTPAATGTVDATAHTVAVEVPFGTDVTALVADFTISNFSTVAVGGTAQVSGTTANDFTSPVVYTVTAEDASTQDWTVTVNVAASVNDIASKGISVYPNPSNGTFTVNVENNFNLQVIDITGKVINTQVLNGTNTVTINNAGVYFLRFSNNEGSVTQKVIVQ